MWPRRTASRKGGAHGGRTAYNWPTVAACCAPLSRSSADQQGRAKLSTRSRSLALVISWSFALSLFRSLALTLSRTRALSLAVAPGLCRSLRFLTARMAAGSVFTSWEAEIEELEAGAAGGLPAGRPQQVTRPPPPSPRAPRYVQVRTTGSTLDHSRRFAGCFCCRLGGRPGRARVGAHGWTRSIRRRGCGRERRRGGGCCRLKEWVLSLAAGSRRVGRRRPIEMVLSTHAATAQRVLSGRRRVGACAGARRVGATWPRPCGGLGRGRRRPGGVACGGFCSGRRRGGPPSGPRGKTEGKAAGKTVCKTM